MNSARKGSRGNEDQKTNKTHGENGTRVSITSLYPLCTTRSHFCLPSTRLGGGGAGWHHVNYDIDHLAGKIRSLIIMHIELRSHCPFPSRYRRGVCHGIFSTLKEADMKKKKLETHINARCNDRFWKPKLWRKQLRLSFLSRDYLAKSYVGRTSRLIFSPPNLVVSYPDLVKMLFGLWQVRKQPVDLKETCVHKTVLERFW